MTIIGVSALRYSSVIIDFLESHNGNGFIVMMTIVMVRIHQIGILIQPTLQVTRIQAAHITPDFSKTISLYKKFYSCVI